MKEIIKAHAFFMRKSQHYIMGNWAEYENLYYPKWNSQLWFYYTRFPVAYIKFMYWSIRDLIVTQLRIM